MHASIELTVSALIIAAATAIAPLSAYAATMPAPSVPAVSATATATAPAGTSVSFTVLAPMVTSTGSGGVLTITRTAGTVTYSIL